MSFNKTAKKVLIKGPLTVVALPVTIPISKTLRTNQRYLRESVTPIDSTLCPFCGVGNLMAVDQLFQYDFEEDVKPLDKGQYWQCNVCTDYVTTKTSNLNELINFIEANGRELYEKGYAYQFRQELIESGELPRIVHKRVMFGTAIFYGNLIALPAFVYGIFTGSFLFAISSLLIGVILALLGISNCYRAWQQYTDSVFTDDPKGQLMWWLRSRSWFLSPFDDDYQENLYFDDEYDNYEQENIVDYAQLLFEYVDPYHYEVIDANIGMLDLSQMIFKPYYSGYFEPYYENQESTVTEYNANKVYPSSVAAKA